MASSLTDFNLSTRDVRFDFGVDINNDGVAEQTYEGNVEYINIYETVESVAGLKTMTLDSSLFLPLASNRWGRSGVRTYAAVKTSDDNWVTEHSESVFVGSTVRSNSIPVNEVRIKATTYNDDFLDKKIARQLFTNSDIATIMSSILLAAGVLIADIDLPLTGVVLPLYLVSNNFPIRYYIEDLAKGALQVVGFNREGAFSSNTILKNDFDGSFPPATVTVTLDDIVKFSNRELRSNMYYNDITVRSQDFELLEDSQFYFNADLSGYEVKTAQNLFFELELEGTNPVTVNPFLPRNSNTNLLGTLGYRANSFFEFFTAEDNGAVNNTGITLVSSSIIPGSEDGQDKLFMVFQNTSGSTRYLKQILVNGTAVNRRPSSTTNAVDNAAIAEDGKRYSLVYESNAIQGGVRAGTIIALLTLNLSAYANVFTFEIPGRPQLELGSVMSIRNRANEEVVGVVYEIDSEISQDEGYSQLITLRSLANLSNYLALDDAAKALDDATLQLL